MNRNDVVDSNADEASQKVDDTKENEGDAQKADNPNVNTPTDKGKTDSKNDTSSEPTYKERREERLEAEVEEEQIEESAEKEPLKLRVLGILSLIGGIAFTPTVIYLIMIVGTVFSGGEISGHTDVTRVLYIVLSVCTAVSVVGFILFGIRLLRKKRRGARRTAEFLIVMLIADTLCSLMLDGVNITLLFYIAIAIILVVMHTSIDPALSQERELNRQKRNKKTQARAASGMLGRDLTGKGYITLHYFNLFWIFVIASFIGDMFETVWHMIVVEPGVYQDRAGLLFGPFSPIYGIGAVLMTVALNRFYRRNFIIIFLVSALIGGVFEYFVSWFLQFAFGITAWDYTGEFGSILGGRTSLVFVVMWGLLGILWVKLLLPLTLWLVNLIPWKWRYSVTAVATVIIGVDALMTLITIDCWYSRMAGIQSDDAVVQFCAEYFNDDFMQDRFQSMEINPADATRTST